jgi:hypothetical protein
MHVCLERSRRGFDDAPAGAVTLADDEVVVPGMDDSHVAARRWRLRAGLWRDRLAAGGAAGGVDRARARGLDLSQVARWASAAPARLAGLPQKRAIAVGRDADLVAFAPEERWRVGELLHRNPVTPYAGRELTGVVRRTWLRGRETDGTPRGRLLSRGGR